MNGKAQKKMKENLCWLDALCKCVRSTNHLFCVIAVKFIGTLLARAEIRNSLIKSRKNIKTLIQSIYSVNKLIDWQITCRH